jgi:hypothetical protein
VVSDDECCSRRALLSGAGAALLGASGPARAAGLGRVGGLALLGAGTVALAGCGAKARPVPKALRKAPETVKRTDIEILDHLLYLERWTVAGYVASIPLLRRPRAKTAKQFLNEELQHTGELLTLIKSVDKKDNGPARPASFPLGHPSDEHEVLALLHELERLQIAAYLDAIPRLAPGAVRAAVSTILSSDAQHIAILRVARGLPAVPSALVSGDE